LAQHPKKLNFFYWFKQLNHLSLKKHRSINLLNDQLFYTRISVFISHLDSFYPA